MLHRPGAALRSLGLLLAIALALPGCMALGFTTVCAVEGETVNPYFGRRYDGQKVLDATSPEGALPSAKLLQDWGEPSSRTAQADGSERWRYSGSLRWAGVVLFIVIIPVPLAIPTGREHVDFIVRDGLVVQAFSSGNAWAWGWACGWAPSFVHGGGFFAGSPSEPTTRFANPFE